MKIRYVADKLRYKRMTTEELREAYLLENLFAADEIRLTYMDVDRAVIGAAMPVEQKLILSTAKELASDYFTERRELGIINIGGRGKVVVEGQTFEVENRDSLYVGRGSQQIEFASADAKEPAAFYLQSYPAHRAFPTKLVKKELANRVELGSDAEANKRTIFQAICPAVCESCQLVMGFTELAEGNIWNTMPPHTHERRSEIYLYFDLDDSDRVFHFMGEPAETRHLVMRNRQAVVSPSWSIHAGAGTKNYSFIWGMGGENQEFTDMDFVAMDELC